MALLSDLQGGLKVHKGYSLQQGLILRKGKIYVVKDSPFKQQILEYIHSNPALGHSGYHKTLHRAKTDFYWPGMRKDIKTLVKECAICQENKPELPYRQKTVAMRRNLKLSPRFMGHSNLSPHRLGCISPSASYRRPYSSVFHVSCLKKKLGNQINPLPTLPPVDGNGEVKPEPEAIIDRRMVHKGRREVTEVLIKWKGASSKDNSWESLWKLRELYPHLVDKVL
ncbi:hypothetical protein SLA2020_433310 [Shorea laevis]